MSINQPARWNRSAYLLLLLLLVLLRLWKLPRGLPSNNPVSIFTAAESNPGKQPSSAGVGLSPSADPTEVGATDMLTGVTRARLLALLRLPEEVCS